MFESCCFELLGGQEISLLHMYANIYTCHTFESCCFGYLRGQEASLSHFENLRLPDCEVRALIRIEIRYVVKRFDECQQEIYGLVWALASS